MSQSTQTTSELRQRMIDDMRMRKLSPKTQSSYIRAVRQFAGYIRSLGCCNRESPGALKKIESDREGPHDTERPRFGLCINSGRWYCRRRELCLQFANP
jgi:integrase-like protein